MEMLPQLSLKIIFLLPKLLPNAIFYTYLNTFSLEKEKNVSGGTFFY